MKMVNPRNLIALVNKYDSSVARKIKKDFPESEYMLNSHRTLGSEDTQPMFCYDAALELSRKSLLIMDQKVSEKLEFLAFYIRKAERIRIIGSVVSAISSAGIIASTGKVFGFGDNEIKLVLSIAVLISSLSVLFSEKLLLKRNGINLHEEFSKITMVSADLLRIKQKIEKQLLKPMSEDELLKVIEGLDDISITIFELDTKLKLHGG